ncbi:alpha/beta hydrolase fold domain-containing protein [Geodermatophilus sp. SYSU D00815]
MPAVTTTPGIVYAVRGDRPLALDLHVPETAAPPPVVVHLHGGSWKFGSRSDHPERLRGLAAHGFAVASVDYRPSTEAPHPAQQEDVRAAVTWLQQHAAEHGADGSRIALWGASAGGHLAALAALTPPTPVAAVVTWFATTDLLRAALRPPLEPRFLPDFEGELLGVADVLADPAAARAASPRWLAHAGAPPFLVMHGDRDRLVPTVQSTVLHEALVDAGADSTLVLVGGASHEDPAFDAPRTLGLVAAFLRAHLGGAA